MPNVDIETIPGITSFHAASARLNRTLVEAEESLLITSGAYETADDFFNLQYTVIEGWFN